MFFTWNTVYDIYHIVCVLQYLEPFVQIGLKGTNHCDNHNPLHWRSASIPQRKFELELIVCASYCYIYEKWRHAKKIDFCNRLFLFFYIVWRYTLRTHVFQACFFACTVNHKKLIWRVLFDWFEEYNDTWLWCHTTSNSLKNTGNTLTAIRFLFYNSRGPFSAFICKSTCFKTDENTYMIWVCYKLGPESVANSWKRFIVEIVWNWQE